MAIQNITVDLALVRMLLNVISHLTGLNILLGGKVSLLVNAVLESHLSKYLASHLYPTRRYGKEARELGFHTLITRVAEGTEEVFI